MTYDYMFKVRGIPRLINLEELKGVGKKQQLNKILVVDLKSQRNYKTNFITILRKFE